MTLLGLALDKNGQPRSKRFNGFRNKEKAIFGLKGILQGVVADKELNEQELIFLDVWLRSQKNLNHDGDVIDLLALIAEILEDGIITFEELDGLDKLIADILDYKNFDSGDVESRINELLGLLLGISADKIIKDSEIDALSTWLSNNKEIQDIWPANVICQRLNEILEDGIVTDEERSDLLDTVNQISGNRFEETGLAHGMATECFEDEVDEILHRDKCFCFTGKFVSGARGAVESTAIKLGANIKNDVTKDLNYLIIGTLASSDWRYSSHGKKIEKALKYKEKGQNILIVGEREWLKSEELIALIGKVSRAEET